MRPKVIDLFCGIGGFSKGFEKAGFNVLLGVDNWDIALKTFEKNHKKSRAIKADLRKLGEDFFRDYENKIDVVIAGPPCQGFAMCGKRDSKDKRNTLFEEVVRVVSIINPKIVVIENVVGLLSMKTPNKEPIKKLILKKLKEIGYETELYILNSADYGVPQIRKRVIFFSSRIGAIGYPLHSHSEKPYLTISGEKIKKWVTVRDALGNIPDTGAKEYLPAKTEFQKLMSDGFKKITNHESINHSPEVVKRMSLVPQGGNWENIPEKYYNVGGKHSNNYRRLDPSKPSITIKHAIKSMIIHPFHNRCLTVREAARLQSFCDSFILCGTKSEQHQQLANAVPPLLGFSIAERLKSVLGKNQEYSISRTSSLKRGTRFTCIDLFSGIGGFRIALERIGGCFIFSSDTDKWANQTYFTNFGEWPKGDINKIPSNKIPDHEVLCAGFPCQAFSIAGRRKGFEDTRGTLFFEVARILKDKKPKAFILENVKGITNHDKGRTIEIIRNTLNEIGYTIFEEVLNAKDYGLPQNRERWFCVGFRKDFKIKEFEFAPKMPLRVTVKYILEKNVKGHEATKTALKHIEKFYNKKYSQKKEHPGGLTIANEIRPSRCIMRDDGISPCLTAKMGTGGNNIPVIVELKRKFTVRECLRLMGFPENFKIKAKSYKSYKQIGNSVPIPIVQKIGEGIIKSLQL